MIQPEPGKDCVTGEPIPVVHADDCRELEREADQQTRFKYEANLRADRAEAEVELYRGQLHDANIRLAEALEANRRSLPPEAIQLLRDIQSNMAIGEPEWSTIESKIESVLRKALLHAEPLKGSAHEA